MDAAALIRLKRGHFVIVRYGRGGEQVARFYARAAIRPHVLLTKWRRNSRRWTQLAKVPVAAVLREATEEEVRRVGIFSTPGALDMRDAGGR